MDTERWHVGHRRLQVVILAGRQLLGHTATGARRVHDDDRRHRVPGDDRDGDVHHSRLRRRPGQPRRPTRRPRPDDRLQPWRPQRDHLLLCHQPRPGDGLRLDDLGRPGRRRRLRPVGRSVVPRRPQPDGDPAPSRRVAGVQRCRHRRPVDHAVDGPRGRTVRRSSRPNRSGRPTDRPTPPTRPTRPNRSNRSNPPIPPIPPILGDTPGIGQTGDAGETTQPPVTGTLPATR